VGCGYIPLIVKIGFVSDKDNYDVATALCAYIVDPFRSVHKGSPIWKRKKGDQGNMFSNQRHVFQEIGWERKNGLVISNTTTATLESRM
jgi:hypothetical protein